MGDLEDRDGLELQAIVIGRILILQHRAQAIARRPVLCDGAQGPATKKLRFFAVSRGCIGA